MGRTDIEIIESLEKSLAALKRPGVPVEAQQAVRDMIELVERFQDNQDSLKEARDICWTNAIDRIAQSQKESVEAIDRIASTLERLAVAQERLAIAAEQDALGRARLLQDQHKLITAYGRLERQLSHRVQKKSNRTGG